MPLDFRNARPGFSKLKSICTNHSGIYNAISLSARDLKSEHYHRKVTHLAAAWFGMGCMCNLIWEMDCLMEQSRLF